jgi:hypothetical protein
MEGILKLTKLVRLTFSKAVCLKHFLLLRWSEISRSESLLGSALESLSEGAWKLWNGLGYGQRMAQQIVPGTGVFLLSDLSVVSGVSFGTGGSLCGVLRKV